MDFEFNEWKISSESPVSSTLSEDTIDENELFEPIKISGSVHM